MEQLERDLKEYMYISIGGIMNSRICPPHTKWYKCKDLLEQKHKAEENCQLWSLVKEGKELSEHTTSSESENMGLLSCVDPRS